jgi:hypothetical protein
MPGTFQNLVCRLEPADFSGLKPTLQKFQMETKGKLGSPIIPETTSGRCNGKLKNLATDFTDLHGLEKKIREICG